MASQEVFNVEMWLPSEFLGDDFFIQEKKYRRAQAALQDLESTLSSPVESATETEESDEEDLVTALTNQMARSSFRDDLVRSTFPTAQTKGPASLACSPQSPLCSAWPEPKGVSQVPSPPSYPEESSAWERIYAPSMLLQDEIEKQRLPGGGILGAPRKHSHPCPVPQKGAAAALGGGFYGFDHPCSPNHNLEQQLKQQQLLKQQLSAAWNRQSRIRAAVAMNSVPPPRGRGCHPPGVNRSAWPSVHPPPHPSSGSGMRAVFLSGARKQSSGTGVFLPRRVGSPTESRKKPACSTVLVPAKVVQALNLNLEEMGAAPLPNLNPRFPGAFFVDNDSRTGMSLPQRRVPLRSAQLPNIVLNPELHLPSEWTY